MIWFTSDTHFYHKNIIEFCDRPYKSVEEMNEGLINNWNSCVSMGDDVYHLGDFAFCGRTKAVDIFNRLNGRIHWVTGNHDKGLKKNEIILAFVEWAKPITNIRVDINGRSQKIVLCHFPILSWEGMSNGSWHLHGHCHGSLPADVHARRMDVGVDANPRGCYPFSLEEVEEYMASITFKPVDHHGSIVSLQLQGIIPYGN